MVTIIQPITIPELKAQDKFRDLIIERITPNNYGKHILTADPDCIGFNIKREYLVGKPEPLPGDKLRLYTEGGSEFHGVDINGVEYYWRTEAERKADHQEMLAKLDREAREKYDRDANDAKIAALPTPLRERMERFRREKPNFWSSESYELFGCTEAAWLFEYLVKEHELSVPIADDLARSLLVDFRLMITSEQIKAGMSKEHTGNTFGAMCMLAQQMLLGRPV